LKYDNTLLYEKNVEKDEKIYQDQEMIARLKSQIEERDQQLRGQEKEISKLLKNLSDANH